MESNEFINRNFKIVDNKDIVRILRRAADLMEIQDENEFKIRSYRNAVYNIERIPSRLDEMVLSELEKLNGIGKSIAASINEITSSGKLEILEQLVKDTPTGIIEMLGIKGIGLKKIKTMWQVLDVQSVDDLLQAIQNDKVRSLKGFGEKTQDKFSRTLKFYLENKPKLHFAKAEIIANDLIEKIKTQNKIQKIEFTGQLRRKLETIDNIELLVEVNESLKFVESLKSLNEIKIDRKISGPYRVCGSLVKTETPIEIFLASKEKFESTLLLTTGTRGHLSHNEAGNKSLLQIAAGNTIASELEAYNNVGLPQIPPELRENFIEFDLVKKGIPKLIELSDLKGILHNHTTYSDGKHTVEEMATYCKSMGHQYLGISDHSKAAFYANGLDEDRVRQQEEEIDRVNEQMNDFKIFKGIEADILPDGSIDFDTETLATFDFVVASIHSVLNMDIVKATDRIIRAVNDPFTTMLGHMTGRLLLIREGYPIDHKAVIDACAINNVIIEANAHPQRLDIDWRWIPYALDQGVLISINPDAHEMKGLHDMYYGVAAARKGGLTKENTFNALPVEKITDYFEQRRKKAMQKANLTS